MHHLHSLCKLPVTFQHVVLAAVFKSLMNCTADPLPTASKQEVAAKLQSYGPNSKVFKEALEASK